MVFNLVYILTPRKSIYPTQTRSRLYRPVAVRKPIEIHGLSTDGSPQFAYGHIDLRGWYCTKLHLLLKIYL
jgi:hypothetical protein